jgi:hypothetical protein
MRRLPYEGLRVEVETIGAANPHRIGRFAVRVVLPEEIPEHYGAMLERVARSCPAHNTLQHGAGVDIQVESGIAAHALTRDAFQTSAGRLPSGVQRTR